MTVVLGEWDDLAKGQLPGYQDDLGSVPKGHLRNHPSQQGLILEKSP